MLLILFAALSVFHDFVITVLLCEVYFIEILESIQIARTLLKNLETNEFLSKSGGWLKKLSNLAINQHTNIYI